MRKVKTILERDSANAGDVIDKANFDDDDEQNVQMKLNKKMIFKGSGKISTRAKLVEQPLGNTTSASVVNTLTEADPCEEEDEA